MKPLSEISGEVADKMCPQLYLRPFDEGPTRYLLSFEDYGYIIEATAVIRGQWQSSGDGYETPCETELVNGDGYLESITAELRDPETDSLITIPDDDLDLLWATLDAEISRYMNHYPN